MRQILSWRFVAAIVAVGVFALVVYILGSRGGGSGVAGADSGDVRRMDFIKLVASIKAEDFAMTANDTVSGNLTMVMPNGQNVTVFPGTPGVVQCDNLTESYQCAVLGQSLGDSVVWFALMPMRGAEFRFELPAIVELEDGFARLVNGWEVPYAQVIDRTDCDPDATSFADFLDKHGTEFVSIYDLSEEAIVAVDCA
jgi:hypothetical protein